MICDWSNHTNLCITTNGKQPRGIHLHAHVCQIRTQERKSPKLYVAFDPLTCPVYSVTQDATLSQPKPEWKERSRPPKTHSFSQGHAHIKRANDHPSTTLHIKVISQSFGLSLPLHLLSNKLNRGGSNALPMPSLQENRGRQLSRHPSMQARTHCVYTAK